MGHLIRLATSCVCMLAGAVEAATENRKLDTYDVLDRAYFVSETQILELRCQPRDDLVRAYCDVVTVAATPEDRYRDARIESARVEGQNAWSCRPRFIAYDQIIRVTARITCARR